MRRSSIGLGGELAADAGDDILVADQLVEELGVPVDRRDRLGAPVRNEIGGVAMRRHVDGMDGLSTGPLPREPRRQRRVRVGKAPVQRVRQFSDVNVHPTS